MSDALRINPGSFRTFKSYTITGALKNPVWKHGMVKENVFNYSHRPTERIFWALIIVRNEQYWVSI